MNKVAVLNEKYRAELFSETAARKGMNSAAIEKDFWICWVLMKIFEHDELKNNLRFKGGTSLSKCFNIIERFSEDIDLVLNWSELTEVDLFEKRSRNQQNKLNEKINRLAIKYIYENLLPIFKNLMEPLCVVNVDLSNGHQVNIEYPKSFGDLYINPFIKLEIGPMGSMVPSAEYTISPYSAEDFPELFEQKDVNVISIQAKRTFWEKITILHAESYRSIPRPRYSRHYYDVYQMTHTKIRNEAIKDLKLLEDVVSFKNKFYYSASAKYDLAKPGTFNLVPDQSAIKLLIRDYEQMREMIFGEYPDFISIIDRIKEIQDKLNGII